MKPITHNFFLTGLFGAAMLLVSGCSSDPMGGSSEGGGYINPKAVIDATVTDLSRAIEGMVTVSDLTISLRSADGTVNKTFSSINEFDVKNRYAAGAYTMEATFGNDESEGFEAPYYYGSTTFNVFESQTTDVSLTAKLANAMVSVTATDAFKESFNTFSTTIHSSGGVYTEVASYEVRPVYVKPGVVKVAGSLNAEGKELTLEFGEFTAKACTHYHVTLDVSGTPGQLELSVIFDDSTEVEPVNITLSEEMVNAPAPALTLRGVDESAVATSVESCRPANDVRFDVAALAGLRSLTLTTANAPGLIAQGWPTEVNLVGESADKKLMESLGLRAPGAVAQGSKFASIVLTDVIPNLTEQNATFTLVAVDRYGKVSQPISLSIQLTPLEIILKSGKTLYYGDETVTLNLEYNGDKTSDLTFQMAEGDSEIWKTVTPVSITKTDEGKYEILLSAESAAATLKFRAAKGTKVSDAVVITRDVPSLTPVVNDGDVWATSARIGINIDGLAAMATLYYSTDGKTYSPLAVKADANGIFSLASLTPATTYSIKATVGSAPTEADKAVIFTTEAATGVPNGDFETLSNTLNLELTQGGRWTMTVTPTAAYYTTTASIKVSEPTGWASTNAKTAWSGSTNANTWYVVPSVYNTTLGWITHQPTAKILGIGQTAYDATPDVYSNLAAASGSNAMVIRNVAWDPAGATVADDKKTGDTSYSNYYGSKEPSISRRSAGCLFLGSYSFDGSLESMNQGVEFASRPLSLTGQFKYERDANDATETGSVTIELLAGNTVIGSASTELPATDSFTTFTLPVKYTIKDRKATSLRILFTSSNRTESEIKTTNYCNKLECVSRGAALTIDNLKFTY